MFEKAKSEKRESAKTALAMGLTAEQVSKITGISIDEINEIKKENSISYNATIYISFVID